MKQSIRFLLGILLFFGCSKDYNTLQDITDHGGFISFETMPETSFNLLELDSEALTGTLWDPNDNAVSFVLTAEYDGSIAVVAEVTSFPTAIELPIAEVLSALEINPESLDSESVISFVGTVTTEDGVEYDGRSPAYNSDNENEGGTATSRLKDYFPNQAMEFSISFY
ncbi:hypothetical protein [Sinomicrobium sp.]